MSVKDIVAMHQAAEKLICRQGQDLGELRRVADTYIKANLQSQSRQQAAPTQSTPAPVDDDLEFFTNPKAAVQKALAEHPALKQLQGHAAQTAQEKAVNVLASKHGDFKEVISNADFQQWIVKSQVRKALFNKAHSQFDVVAADELLSTWKELQAAKAPAQSQGVSKETQKQARQNGLNAAKFPSGNGNPATEGSKKIYRRADVIELMQTDPERYEALSSEIQQAYQEGRVR